MKLIDLTLDSDYRNKREKETPQVYTAVKTSFPSPYLSFSKVPT